MRPDDPPAHLQLVRQTIEEQKNSWQFVSSYPVGDQSPIPNTEIRIYRLQTESTPRPLAIPNTRNDRPVR
jgi:hypothetical protein